MNEQISAGQLAGSWALFWPVVFGLLAVLVIVLLTARSKSGDKKFGLLYGADKRPSTSKLAAYLWTLGLAFAGIVLLSAALLNENVDTGSLGLDGIPDEYLILLGGPFASLVAAKAIVQAKVEAGTLQKTEAPASAPQRGGFVSNDDGTGSLVDAQYLVFNVILLVYFVVALLKDRVLPDLPLSLVALTGTGAATYVANKAVERSAAKITKVVHSAAPPAAAPADQRSHLRIHGENLLAKGNTEDQIKQISVSGAQVDEVTWLADTLIDAKLDRRLTSGTVITVIVTTAAGTTVTLDGITID